MARASMRAAGQGATRLFLEVAEDNVAARALYETTQEVCEAHGLPAYEISNHARRLFALSR